MSAGKNLHEMENVVTKGAKAADPMPSLDHNTPGQTSSWEDLGGPTPENYRPDDSSAKLKEPSVRTVSDVVNRKAKAADPMPKVSHSTPGQSGMKEESEAEEENLVQEEDAIENSSEEISEEETQEDEYDMEEDVNALLFGEELSEEFQEKARMIFETAINSKVAAIKRDLEERYLETLENEIDDVKESIVDRVDAYLEYVADEWIQENALAIEQGIKTEMMGSFLSGLRSLFEEHYVNVPDEKYDLINSMAEKIDEMEEKLNEQIEKNVALNRRLAESKSDGIFAEISEGLPLIQKEKLASLAENLEFDSEEGYREKLVTLKESYFSSNGDSRETISENLTESADVIEMPGRDVTPTMERYLQTLSRVSKK